MSRTDTHMDAMLRHLGAAYYQSLHGDGTAVDVVRAVESVTAANGRHGTKQRLRQHANGAAHAGPWRPGFRLPGHHWRVRDVMTTDVASADMAASCKEVARLMTERSVNALPVLAKDGRVLGVVSEADVLRKQERRFGRMGTGLPRRTRRERAQAAARTAAQLMTTPPITTHPDAALGSAARLMNGHRIRRLPVVDESGKLLGIVSRRDLLRVFVRPDDEIAADVTAVITSILLVDLSAVAVSAHDGVVTLAGSLSRPDAAAAAVRLASDVDGVVDVIDKLTRQPAAEHDG